MNANKNVTVTECELRYDFVKSIGAVIAQTALSHFGCTLVCFAALKLYASANTQWVYVTYTNSDVMCVPSIWKREIKDPTLLIRKYFLLG